MARAWGSLGWKVNFLMLRAFDFVFIFYFLAFQKMEKRQLSPIPMLTAIGI